MSKQPATAADNKRVREAVSRIVADCKTKGCEFCADLRRELAGANEPDDIHLID